MKFSKANMRYLVFRPSTEKVVAVFMDETDAVLYAWQSGLKVKPVLAEHLREGNHYENIS